MVLVNGSTGFDNPYGVNPFWPFGPGEATIADGVFYAASGHNYGPPLFKNAKIYAINATTWRVNLGLPKLRYHEQYASGRRLHAVL